MIEIPAKLAGLERDDHGLPIPHFVTWIADRPEYAKIDPLKIKACVVENTCWICGQTLGQFKSFVSHPIAAVTRMVPQPGSHIGCAEYAAKVCPHFHSAIDGEGMPVVMIWSTKLVEFGWAKTGSPIFLLGTPDLVGFWHLGQEASRAQVECSLDSEMVKLRGMMADEVPEIRQRIEVLLEDAKLKYLPKEPEDVADQKED